MPVWTEIHGSLQSASYLYIHWTPRALTSAFNWLEMKLNSHFHLVQRLQLIDAVPLLHIYLHGLVLNYAQGQIYFEVNNVGPLDPSQS
jgi:hypothetical protein